MGDVARYPLPATRYPLPSRYTRRVAKYDPLRDHLNCLPRFQKRLTMSFATIEGLLGEPLPPSAHQYDDWWRGRARWRKVIEGRPWEEVGWVVDELDLHSRLVTFRRQE